MWDNKSYFSGTVLAIIPPNPEGCAMLQVFFVYKFITSPPLYPLSTHKISSVFLFEGFAIVYKMVLTRLNLGERQTFSHLKPSVANFKKQFPEGRNTLTYNVTHPCKCYKSKHRLESALTLVRYPTTEVISVGQAIKRTRATIPPLPWPEYI